VYIHVCIFVNFYIEVCVCTHTHIYIYIYICVYIGLTLVAPRACVYVHARALTPPHIYIFTNAAQGASFSSMSSLRVAIRTNVLMNRIRITFCVWSTMVIRQKGRAAAARLNSRLVIQTIKSYYQSGFELTRVALLIAVFFFDRWQ